MTIDFDRVDSGVAAAGFNSFDELLKVVELAQEFLKLALGRVQSVFADNAAKTKPTMSRPHQRIM